MDYNQALSYIHSIPKFRRPLGNEKLEKLLKALGNPHEDIFPAIYGSTPPDDVEALGIVESFSAASAVVAADVAAKTSLVHLLELRLARGMCGKSYVLLTGSVSAVTAAIERAQQETADRGMFLDSSVIPRPDQKLWQSIL